MTTVVVGGGLAGSLIARALHLAGQDVMVVEAARDPGGIARALHRDGYHLEPAVGSVSLPHPHLAPLLVGLPLKVRPVHPSRRRRFLRHRGRTIEIRPGPRLVSSPLLSIRGKLRAAGEALIPAGGGDQETLEQFLVRRLGAEGGHLVAGALAAGVHAGDPTALSVGAAFPALLKLERNHGSLLRAGIALRRKADTTPPAMHVVAGGTARIAKAVADSLQGRWMKCWPVSRLERAGERWRVHGPGVIEAQRVVAAVPPEVLGTIYPPLRSEPLPYAPVAVVWLGTEAADLPAGYGALIGPDEEFMTLGFLYESSYAPDRAPQGAGLIKAIVGGAGNPAVTTWHDDELVERVADELAQVLGFLPTVRATYVVRHVPGIPQYTSARQARVAELRRHLPPGLAVAGWSYDGVGVSRLAAAAGRLARASSASARR